MSKTPKTRQAKPAKPMSLLKFIVESGYIAPCREIKTLTRDAGTGWWIIATKGRGLSLDDMRAACVGAGYLYDTPWRGGVSVSTVNDLLEAIDLELRGFKQYPYQVTPEDELTSPQERRWLDMSPAEREEYVAETRAFEATQCPF